MTADEIVAELRNLQLEELEVVSDGLDDLYVELLERRRQQAAQAPGTYRTWNDVLADWAADGTDDLPEDFAVNHDHYLHGAPKRW
jgi:hypothetical protein